MSWEVNAINYPETTVPSSLLLSGIGIEQRSVRLKLIANHMSTPHIAWYTHKNPYGCWICDLIVMAIDMEEEINLYKTKSSLDSMNGSSSQDLQESREDE